MAKRKSKTDEQVYKEWCESRDCREVSYSDLIEMGYEPGQGYPSVTLDGDGDVIVIEKFPIPHSNGLFTLVDQEWFQG